MTIRRHTREVSVAGAIIVLLAILAIAAPGYFGRENLKDIFLANVPVLIVAIGMTLVILTGQIDISVGSVFAVCGVAAGVCAKSGMSMPVVVLAACLTGAALGALNGALVVYLRIPSIVATLAAMVALRDGLRWTTQGAWIADLPRGFQWVGLSQGSYPAFILLIAGVLLTLTNWGLRNLPAGRAIYATGSNEEAARLAGIDARLCVFSALLVTGALTGLAAVLNSVRFNQIPSNAGLGLELKVIAAVVVGGAAIAGGRGTILGTTLGVILLGAIGPALTFLGINAYWEKALQGAIILVAVTADALQGRFRLSEIHRNATGVAEIRT
jgi:rhamnose transport system permease protein